MSWQISTSPLSSSEKTRLRELERTIERGLATFLTIGKALIEIRDRRLHREHYGNFEAYLRDRWAIGISRGNQLIAAVQVSETLLASGVNPATINACNEHQLRPLTRLEPELQPAAWAVATAIEEKPRTSTLAAVVQTIQAGIHEACVEQNGLTAPKPSTEPQGNPQKHLPAISPFPEREMRPDQGARSSNRVPEPALSSMEQTRSRFLASFVRLASNCSLSPRELAAGDYLVRAKKHLAACAKLSRFCEDFATELQARFPACA